MTPEQFGQLQTWLIQVYFPAIQVWLVLFLVAIVFMIIFIVMMISVRAGLSNLL